MPRSPESGRSSGSKKVTRPDGDIAGRVVWDRREDGRRQAPISRLGSVGVAHPDQANVAPAVITLDVTAAVDRGCIGAGSDGGTDQRAGGNADTKADNKTRNGLDPTPRVDN